MDTKETIIKIFCSECAGHTNHNVLAKKKIDSETDDGFHLRSLCIILANVLDVATYVTLNPPGQKMQFDPETGEMLFDWQTYPRSKGQRSPPIDDIALSPMEIRII